MRYFISREGTGARKNIWAHWSNTEGIYICGNADVIESSITTVDQLELGDVDEVDYITVRDEMKKSDFEHGLMTLTVIAKRN